MPFQSQVNITPAIAVSGDFASSNPRSSYPVGEASLVAGSPGVIVGRFAWIKEDGLTVVNAGGGVPDGFVHREQQSTITTWLAETSNTIVVGQPVTLMTSGDYYVTCLNEAKRGQKVFANVTNGNVQAGDAGATIASFQETSFTITRGCSAGELAIISK